MNIYDLELQLSDALRLLDLALDHGHSLNRHGCDCRKGVTCLACEIRDRIAFGRSALSVSGHEVTS
jgi:hypothetical protein